MKILFAALALLIFADLASADAIWQYQGQSVSGDVGPFFGNPCGCALDGSVTLDNAGDVTAWSFTAGSETLTNSNSTGLLGQLLFTTFNPEANYFRWRFLLTGNDGTVFSSQFDGSFGDATDASVTGLTINQMVNDNPGTWVDPAIATPEPGTLLLLGAGLAVFSLKRRRKPADTTVWEPLS